MACIEESISEREGKQFEERLNSKVKLDMYKRFGKEVEFKRYLRGVGDAGTRLLFKFRSGTHGLNEELGRHRGRVGKSEYVLCGAECKSVVHVLWECSAYSNIRVTFVEKLRELLGNRYAKFDKLNSTEKTAYVLGSELWEYDFDDLLSLVKEYVVGVWDARKQKLYCDDSCPSQLQSLAEDLQLAGVEGQMDGKFCSSGEGGTDGKESVCACMCGSAHDCGWLMAVMLW